MITLEQLKKGQQWRCNDGAHRTILTIGARLIEYRVQKGKAKSSRLHSTKDAFIEALNKLEPVLEDKPVRESFHF
ncbi:MAG: hypothetical protein JWM99_3176 [Verrucomicrobiales bacterium]|jgi:hypothetical protein|nr:hypothetical protein [Verrucomicrobiales bacterium]